MTPSVDKGAPISRTGVQHTGQPLTELYNALPPQLSRTFVASATAIPRWLGDSFLESPVKSTAISVLFWKNFGITTPLKFLGSSLGLYNDPNLVHNTASDVTENVMDTTQQTLLGAIHGVGKSLFKSAESFGNDAKDQWNEGLDRSFQSQEQQRAYARAQMNGECVIDKECSDTFIQGPTSGSFVIPAIFLLATLGLCAYAYQLLTSEAQVNEKKSDKSSTSKA